MSPPIDQSSIHLETWTQLDGKVKKQVVAQGDENDPGTYIFVYGIKPENENYVHAKNRIIDINVEEMVDPEILKLRPKTPHGVWTRIKEIG